jgi:type II secretory pathway pseudopilin PulG
MKHNSESGFSYIDVMIALVILLVGVLGLLSGITASIVQTRSQEQQLLAKQITTSTMESIMSVKESVRETVANFIGWGAVGNVGTNPNPINGVNQGIFLTGFRPVTTNPGPDEIVGTADDTGAPVQGMQRQIVITDLCDPDRPSPAPLCDPGPAGQFPVRFRSVQITVRYQAGAIMQQEVLNTVLTDYTVQN